MIKFYYAPRSSASRVHVALEELGVPYEKIRVHLDKGEQKKPDFLAINPNGKIPALVDGDVKMFESLAMILYLGEKYGVAKGLWPKLGTPEHGEALAWSVWATAELMPPVFECVLHGGNVQWAHPKEHRNAYFVEQGKKRWEELVAVLDKHLEGREWMLGKTFTLVDVAVAPVLAMGQMFMNLPIAGKNVQGLMQRVTSRPAFGKVMSEA